MNETVRPRYIFTLLVCLLPLAPAVVGTANAQEDHPLKLESYPKTSRVLLANVRAEVAPKRQMLVTAPTTGDLEFFVEPRSQHLDEGTRIAALNLEQLDLEERLVEIERRLLQTGERTSWEAEKISATENSEAALTKARSELALVHQLQANPEMATAFFRRSGETETEADQLPMMEQRLETRIKALEEHLKFLRDDELLGMEWQERELRLKQKELRLETQKAASELVMPFNGFLELMIDLDPDEKTVPVAGGKDLFRIRDLTSVFVHLPASNPEWRFLDTARLHVEIGSGSNLVRAEFSNERVDGRIGETEKIFTFRVTFNEESAHRYIGGTVTADLLMDLDGIGRSVPKLDLIRSYPEAFSEGGYESAVTAAFPGHRVMAIGRDTVVVASEPTE
ncbi:MAG: hypothetical protein ACFB21_16220 [Opitutales bacterium]